MEKSCLDKQCIKGRLKEILDKQQRNIEKERPKIICPMEGRHHINTIPIILYCDCSTPYKVDGVTTCFDKCTDKERFVCFTTFLFRIIDLDGDCAVFELLKFRKQPCKPSSNGHVCTPCCQLNGSDVDDLIATGICITVDISIFTTIQCLPGMCL